MNSKTTNPYERIVTFKVPNALYNKINKEADKRLMNKSTLIRSLILKELNAKIL